MSSDPTPTDGPHEGLGAERVTEVTRDGLTLDVLDEGPLDGPVVVLLHGFPERATSWRLVAPLLHAAGLRTLAVDQRGHSPRARPRGRRAYAVQEFAHDALAVAAAATRASGGGRVHLVGHDWGAATAWVAATLAPEKVASLTALSVPHPEAFMRSWFTSRQGLKSWYMASFNIPRLPERLARREGGQFDRLLGGGFGMTPEEVARFRREVVEDGALPGGLGWYRALPFMDRSLLGRRVTVPTTLVWSDGDAAICRAPVDATERYVHAPYELVVLQGVTHWIPTQAPEAAAEAIIERVLTA